MSTDMGATWNDITDNATFQGTQSENLTLLNTPLNLNGALFRATFSFCNSAFFSNSANLFVIEIPDAGLDATQVFCFDGTPGDLFDALGGTPDPGGNWSPSLSGGNGIFAPLLDPEGVYTYTVDNGYCDPVQATVTVQIAEAPVILDVVIIDFNDDNHIEIQVTGNGDYEYSIDGVNYQENNFFRNVSAGVYTVFVREANGCGLANREVFVLNYPKFFTPNGDGYNDTWHILGLDPQLNASVYVHDRLGKLLKVLTPNDFGWDGTYNGADMPSSDYWFKFMDSGDRVVTGHFALKR
ncbi:MAG: T9SS type B sorting domain-containing protein [Flavobacteriaceae bacterium]